MSAAQQRRQDVLAAALRHRDMILQLDHGAVRKVTATERWKPAHPDRFEARLRRRAARRIGLSLDVAATSSTSFATLLSTSETPAALVALCGAACQSGSLRLVLNAELWAELADALDVPGRQAELRKTALSQSPKDLRAIDPKRSSPDAENLAQIIYDEGVLCWQCWAAQQPADIQLYLSHLAPELTERDENGAAVREGQSATARARLFDTILQRHETESECEAKA